MPELRRLQRVFVGGEQAVGGKQKAGGRKEWSAGNPKREHLIGVRMWELTESIEIRCVSDLNLEMLDLYLPCDYAKLVQGEIEVSPVRYPTSVVYTCGQYLSAARSVVEGVTAFRDGGIVVERRISGNGSSPVLDVGDLWDAIRRVAIRGGHLCARRHTRTARLAVGVIANATALDIEDTEGKQHIARLNGGQLCARAAFDLVPQDRIGKESDRALGELWSELRRHLDLVGPDRRFAGPVPVLDASPKGIHTVTEDVPAKSAGLRKVC